MLTRKTLAPQRRAVADAVALAIASIGALSAPALAQEAADAAKDKPKTEQAQTQDKPAEPAAKPQGGEQQTITVTGSRRLSETFVREKRTAARVVDSVSETEAGKLPAQNAAELVGMLPGVMTFTDRTGSDNLTTTEGRFASVRGIRPDLNITTMDGLNLAIPNQAGRANFLDWFPVSLAKRVEVIKTFAPEDDASAIGGQINLVTRSGFDYPRGVFNIDVSTTQDQLDNGLRKRQRPFDASVVFGRKLSAEVAITGTANFNRRDVEVPSRENVGRVAFNADGSRATFFPGFNNFIGATPGNGIAVPLINRLYAGNVQSDRYGFGARMDFRPNDSTEAWLTAIYTKLNQDLAQSYSDVRQPFLCFAFFGCVNRAESQTGSTGTIRVAFNDAAFTETQTSKNVSQLGAIQAGVRKRFSDDWKLDVRASLSEAKQDQEDHFSFFGQDRRDILINYDLSNPLSPQFSVDDAANVFNPSTYKLRRVDYIPLRLKERVLDTVAALAFNADPEDLGWGFKGGVRLKTSDRSFREAFYQHTPAAGSPDITASSLLSGVDPFTLGIPGISATSRPVLLDPTRRNAELLPLITDSSLFDRSTITDLENNYGIKETTAALFGQATYRSGPVQAIGGLRYERTKLAANGYRKTDAGPFEPINVSTSQGFMLPSFIVNFDATRELKLRLAYSRTLGRPTYDALAPKGETLTTDASLGTATLSKANPNLRPRKSDNFDLASEWYFDAGRSLASFGVFEKRIKDEIFVSTRIEPMLINGTTYATTVIEPMNAESAKLRGVEMSLVKAFTFLPAPFDKFGVQANASLISGDFSLQRPRLDGNGTQTPGFLPGQPTRIYNAALYYAGSQLDMNLSFNRTGSFIVGFFPDAPQNDIYHLGRTIVNAKLSYSLDKALKVFVAGYNLTSKDLVEVSGPPELKNIRRTYRSGAGVSVGLSYSLGN